MVARTFSIAAAVAAACAGCASEGTKPPETAPPGAGAPTTSDDERQGGGVSDGDEGEGDDLASPSGASAAAGGGAPPTPSTAGGLYGEVERELGLMRSSRYSHRTDVDEAAGRFDYDCSGFVSYAVARAAPASYEALRAFAGRRPLAKHY